MASSGTLTSSKPARTRSNENSHLSLMGMQNGIATLEYTLIAPYKIYTLLPYDPPITFVGIYPKELILIANRYVWQLYSKLPRLGSN